MRKARSQLSKLTLRQAGNNGEFHNTQSPYAVGNEVDEIQRRLNAMQHQQSMMQQNQPVYNDPAQNYGFPQPMPSAGFQQPMPSVMAQQPIQEAYHQPVVSPYAPRVQAAQTPVSYNEPSPTARTQEAASPQLDTIKSALEQMSSKLHAINHANAASGNNQTAFLQQSEILKQHYNHINAELQELKASIAGVASADVSDASLQIIQETLAANYRAIMQQLESSQPSQIDSSVFSAALEASHKDLSKQIIDMKQSIETASNNPNIYAKTLEVSHEDITKRLDDMHNALQASIAAPDLYVGTIENNHKELSQQVLALHDAIEKIESGSSEAPQTDLSSIEMRLEEITRAVVALSLNDGSVNNLERIEARVSDMAKTLDGFSIPQAQSDDASFEKFEAKLSDITTLMHASAPDLSGVEMQIGKLSEKIENFSAVSMSAPISGSENNALLKRMDELVEQISQAQTQPKNITSNDTIAHQLEQISGAVDKLSMPVSNVVSDDGSATNELVIQQLEQIAMAIDQLAMPSADTMSAEQFASIEQQLSQISNQMNTSVPSGEFSLDPITSRLGGIEEQLGATRDITIELATKAAEDAVKMSVQAMPQMAAGGASMDSSAINSMSEILVQLNQETQTNNSKSIEAFGAVTQTLDLMVQRLGAIEAGISSQNFVAPVMQQERPVSTAQAFVQPVEEAPALETEVEAPEITGEVAQAPKNPAVDLVKAARMTLDKEPILPEPHANAGFKEAVLDTVVEQASEEAEYIADSVELPQVETPEMAMETMPEIEDEPLLEVGSDIALEPGTGGPDLAALVRKANEQRKNNTDTGISAGANVDSSGAEFMAAARRAAQAAAQEAGAVEEEIEEKTKKGLFASLPELFAKRKKVIIMAAAAALFIALAVPLASKFLGGEVVQVAEVDNTVTIEQSSDAVLPEASILPAQNTVTPIQTTDEVETTVSVTSEVSSPELNTQAAPQEINLASINLNENPAPVSFQLPDELNFAPAKLKAAVQNGEPAALFEIGKRYTDGIGTEKDLAKAAEWYERAANIGFAPAQYIIGNFNEKGLGIEKNPAVAAEWYEQAAKGGNIIAMHNLAVLTATPNALSAQPDMDAAFKWFSNAADYGVRDSQVNAGIFHTKGLGTEVNLIEAYKWFAIAAKAGDKDAGNKRDVIVNAIQPDQLDIAKALVKDWKPLEVVKAANEVPVNETWKSLQTVAEAPVKIDRNTIAQTQNLLSKVGFNAGVADGVMGQKTRNAIAAFQKKSGLPVNGRIDGVFLKALKAVAI